MPVPIPTRLPTRSRGSASTATRCFLSASSDAGSARHGQTLSRTTDCTPMRASTLERPLRMSIALRARSLRSSMRPTFPPGCVLGPALSSNGWLRSKVQFTASIRPTSSCTKLVRSTRSSMSSASAQHLNRWASNMSCAPRLASVAASCKQPTERSPTRPRQQSRSSPKLARRRTACQ